MEKLSNLLETYIREEPKRDTTPKSERIQQIEEFAHKEKKAEIIKAWTEIEDHPQAQDLKSPVGSAFDKSDLDQDMLAAYMAIGEGGILYSSFEDSFWVRYKGKLIRVL